MNASRIDVMSRDEASKGACSPRKWIAPPRMPGIRATSLVDETQTGKEGRHHENLHTWPPSRCRAAKSHRFRANPGLADGSAAWPELSSPLRCESHQRRDLAVPSDSPDTWLPILVTFRV